MKTDTINGLLRAASPTGHDPETAQAARACALCTDPLLVWRDAQSQQEYEISGICQRCQDKVFGADTKLTQSCEVQWYDLAKVFVHHGEIFASSIHGMGCSMSMLVDSLPREVVGFLQAAPMMVLCGGAIRDVVRGLPAKDFDFACLDWEAWERLPAPIIPETPPLMDDFTIDSLLAEVVWTGAFHQA